MELPSGYDRTYINLKATKVHMVPAGIIYILNSTTSDDIYYHLIRSIVDKVSSPVRS